MKQKVEWQDSPEVFEAVVDALYPSDEVQVVARDERNSYGDRGTIEIKTPDGRRFMLELHELT